MCGKTTSKNRASPARVTSTPTRYTARTNLTWTLRVRDHLVMEGLPIVVREVGAHQHLHLPLAANVGLLTVAGLLSAFLFALMIQVSDRAAGWADAHPKPSAPTSDYSNYLLELAANAGYTSLVAVATSVTFAVASVNRVIATTLASQCGDHCEGARSRPGCIRVS
jgi:hypothetical protein